MKAALSTMWWGEGEEALEELVRRTRSLGFEYVELEYRRSAVSLPRLRGALAQAGLAVGSVHAPFPGPAGRGSALCQADLAAVDEQARRRAEELVAGTLEEAARWGAGLVVLHGGDVESLRPLEGRLRELHEAGRVGAEEYGRLQEELRQRRAVEAPRRLEWLHGALDRLLPQARSLGVVIGLENRAHYRDLPSLNEMGLLLDEFGPAVGYWHDVGHAFRLEALGFYPQEAWLQRYSGRLVGIHLHDSVGMDDHRPPGQGKVDFAQLVRHFRPQALRVLEVRSDYSGEEIAAGLAHLRTTGVLL